MGILSAGHCVFVVLLSGESKVTLQWSELALFLLLRTLFSKSSTDADFAQTVHFASLTSRATASVQHRPDRSQCRIQKIQNRLHQPIHHWKYHHPIRLRYPPTGRSGEIVDGITRANHGVPPETTPQHPEPRFMAKAQGMCPVRGRKFGKQPN